MKVRLYTPADYQLIRLWWLGHKMGEVSEAMLPPLGVVVECDKGHPVAAGWVYLALNVGVAWMAWATTKPGLKGKESLEALRVLVEGMEVALPKEYGVVFTETRSLGVTRFLKRQGFTVNHAATQLFKVIER